MLAFEIYVNTVKVCTAGLDELAFINALLVSLKMDGNPEERRLEFLVNGGKDEKLTAWMQPIFDNMAYLLSNRLSGGGDKES